MPKTEEELQKEQKKQDEIARKQALQDLRKILSLAEGRRAIYRIIYGPHMGALEEVVDIDSTNTVIFHQGQRQVARALLNECLEANSKRTRAMLKESLDAT